MDKPTKPTNLMPRSFGGTKNNFSASLQSSGYEDGVPAIYGGDNLNYQLDATGKELDYCEKICDFINNIPINKTITVDSNNKLVYANTLNFLSRNIGEIVQSTIPLTDAGLHLLDGALISGSGSYSAFVDYIADLYGDGTNVPSYFCSESDWQTSVNTYGVCGKFVYDSTNNTVRLPKITGIIEGTTDASALGTLINAGLPNITGQIVRPSTSTLGLVNEIPNASGAFSLIYNETSHSYDAATVSATRTTGFYFDASRSNSIYGNSSTVQPQTIRVLYYIVISTSTKTEIEVDIDEIATDLNSKADVDGTNMVASVKNFDGQYIANIQSLSSATAVGQYSIDLSSYLPNDGYNYMIYGYFYGISSGLCWCDIKSSIQSSWLRIGVMNNTYTTSDFLIPIGTNRTLTYSIANTALSVGDFYTVGYRRIGTNS